MNGEKRSNESSSYYPIYAYIRRCDSKDSGTQELAIRPPHNSFSYVNLINGIIKKYAVTLRERW